MNGDILKNQPGKHGKVPGHSPATNPVAGNRGPAGIAHDFSNLLTAIMMYSGLLASKIQDDPQLKHYIEEIRTSAERGAQLVEQLAELEHNGNRKLPVPLRTRKDFPGS